VRQVIQLIQNLSLHIVAGVCISAIFIGDIFQIEIESPALTVLGVSVWLIYTLDHLIDVNDKEQFLSQRHQFHKDNYNTFIIFLPWISILLLYNIFKLPLITIIAGGILVGLIGVYFFTFKVYSKRITSYKEIFIAIGFSTGIFLASIHHYSSINFLTFGFYLQFLLLAYLNVLIISFVDYNMDKEEGFSSIGSRKDKEFISKLVSKFFIILFFVSVILIFFSFPSVLPSFTMLLMVFSLFLIFKFGIEKLSAEQVHFLADAVFLLPVIYFLIKLLNF
jgi:4-hydroxybenzoate polyprenyltransferase